MATAIVKTIEKPRLSVKTQTLAAMPLMSKAGIGRAKQQLRCYIEKLNNNPTWKKEQLNMMIK